MLGQEVVGLLDAKKLPHVDTDMDCDITDQGKIASFIAGKRIDWIVNCSAYTAVDKAETEEHIAEKVNSMGPGNLGAAASRIGARVIHISTDYVFNGKGTTPYLEDDHIDPINAYGRTKAHGEDALRGSSSMYFIIRTAWLYGIHGKNFVYTMLRLMNERNEVFVVNDQFGTPTYAPDLAAAIVSIMEQDSRSYGIYHYTNEEKTCWFEFAEEIYKVASERGWISHNCVIKPISTDQYPAKTIRPKYSVLSKRKIVDTFGMIIPSWQDGLRRFFMNTTWRESILDPKRSG